MIKKFIGILFSAAAIAVMVFAVLGRDRYRSLIGETTFAVPSFFRSGPNSADASEPADAPAAVPAPTAAQADSDEADYLDDDELLTPDLFSSDDY